MTGGGKDLKNRYKSCYYFPETFKNLKYLAKQFSKFPTPRHENKLMGRKGSIIIEFAICMPILIILLFYFHDLVKLKRYYSQTEFAAQQFANIIQNISQKRGNKRITNNDLRYACYLSHLTIYPGTMMLSNEIGYGFAHRQELFMAYVVGNSDGTASCKWTLHLPTAGATSPKTYEIIKSKKESPYSSLIKFKSNAAPSEIYPTLKVSSGEEKIIVESTIMFRPAFARYDGSKPGSAKKAFGYFLLNPKPETKASTSEAQEWHYHSVVIFTPRAGLFNENPPTEN